jgi:group I intron endonuclease
MIGIYLITNKLNNKVYVGSSQDINRRFYLHKFYLDKNNHTNLHLQNAWNEYGKDNFTFSILEEIIDSSLLLQKEKEYILEYCSTDREFGYNICEDTLAPMRGRKHNEVSKEKMIKSKIGDKNSFYGKHHTDETKAILREQMKGRKLSASHKEKVLKSGYQNGESNLNAKLTIEIVNQIRDEYSKRETKYGFFKEIAERYNIHSSTVRRIINNTTYKTGEINAD